MFKEDRGFNLRVYAYFKYFLIIKMYLKIYVFRKNNFNGMNS